MLSKGLQTYTNLQHTQCVKKHPIWQRMASLNPLQEALVHDAAATPGHALNVAHKRKLDKSWEQCRRQGIEFIPVAAEFLGAPLP